MTETTYQTACEAIKKLSGGFTPEYILVLGSGLAAFADGIDGAAVIPYGDIPGFLPSTAPYHRGRLVLGLAGGKKVACMDGRLHMYEGYTAKDVVFPLRVLRLSGAHTAILTNAAGGINEGFSAGDIMLIEDHINFQGQNPLTGKNEELFGPRFPDMSYAYDPVLREKARKCAEKLGISLKSGVYLGCAGPSYETPAEIRAFRVLGADAVGMSTVPETIAANHCGMRVLAVSLISNMAAGMTVNRLTQEEVEETGRAKSAVLGALVKAVLETL